MNEPSPPSFGKTRVACDPGVRQRRRIDVPVRQVSPSGRAHWFGYYDIAAFDHTGARLLVCASDFEWRAPTPSDTLELGVIDLDDGDRFSAFGTSRSWGWQQGCMLQWRPGHADEIVWNDRVGDTRVTRLMNLRRGDMRVLQSAFYALSPDGSQALACNLDRLEWMRPGYGCSALHVHRPRELAPSDDGVTLIELDRGEHRLLLSLADLAAFEPDPRSRGCWHYVNHLSFSPDARRFAFIHRWRRNLWTPRPYRAVAGFASRLVVGSIDGRELRVLDDSGHTSHFAWRSPQQLVAWTRPRGRPAGLYALHVADGTREQLPGFVENGHHSYLTLPGDTEPSWMVNDTYPKPSRLAQELYLVHLSSGERFDLGTFPIAGPLKIGETRCDLHPRLAPGGHRVCFDSAHSGQRQLYVAELGDLLHSGARSDVV